MKKWNQKKAKKMIESMTKIERAQLKLIINKIEQKEENEIYEKFKRDIVESQIRQKAVGDALDELGKAVLHSFEPFLKWCINVLNKITGVKK